MKLFRNTFLALALLIGLPALVAPPAMATQILLNNVKSKLTAAVGVSDTTITITAGDGALFAAATAGNTITATLIKVSGFNEVAFEIVTVTARSGDTLTITRGRESTAALTFAVGDVISVRFTAGMTPGAIGAISASSTDTLTNKTFDTAGTGNVFKINGTGITAISGTGSVCMTVSCAMTTPNIGVATATTVNKVTITAPASAATLTIPDGVTLTGPASSGTAATLGNTETITGIKTFGSAGAVGRFKLAGTTSGTTIVDATAVASGTITIPAATDTLVGKATTDTFTNKTYDTAGSGNVLSVGGVNIATAWTAYTPTVTAGSGSFTTTSAAGRYKQIGKTATFSAAITVTTIGTGGGSVNFTLPVTANAANSTFCSGRETGSTGSALFAFNSSTTVANITRYDNIFIGANGYVYNISCTYEAA